MIKFKAEFGYGIGVFRMECVAETEKFIILEKRREAKDSNYHHYADSFQEAKNFLIERANMKIRQAQSQLDREKSELQKINNLKEQ